MNKRIKELIAESFLEAAQALEAGGAAGRAGNAAAAVRGADAFAASAADRGPVVAVTAPGSEHGEENILAGALAAAEQGVEVVYIGKLCHERLTCAAAADEAEAHRVMEKLFADGKIQGAVTMHYPFALGVSTVGRVVTPARGRAMYLANTTGTSATNRAEAMVRNALCGIVAAKACGNPAPSVGIANIDGANQAETALKKLTQGGYPIRFAASGRADGGALLRGNDLLTGAADIAVTDALTGNLLIKMLAAFQSGGDYETVGWGYGPGLGKGQENLIMILSRASGATVVTGALLYAAQLIRGNWKEVWRKEYALAKKAGLEEICAGLGKGSRGAGSGAGGSARDGAGAGSGAETAKSGGPEASQEAGAGPVMPPKEVVTASIAGIEVMDMEDAAAALWQKGIYAECGMGCTGPIILVSEKNLETAKKLLRETGFLGE